MYLAAGKPPSLFSPEEAPLRSRARRCAQTARVTPRAGKSPLVASVRSLFGSMDNVCCSTLGSLRGSSPAVRHRSGRAADAGPWAPFPSWFFLCLFVLQLRTLAGFPLSVTAAHLHATAPCARCALGMTERRRTVALAPTPTLTCFYSARRVSASFYGFPPLGGSGATRDWLVSPCTGAREEFICAQKEMRSLLEVCVFSSFVLQPS